MLVTLRVQEIKNCGFKFLILGSERNLLMFEFDYYEVIPRPITLVISGLILPITQVKVSHDDSQSSYRTNYCIEVLPSFVTM